MEVWRMDIGNGFGGDDRQRYLRIALIAGVALVVLLLILIVVAIVRGRSGGGTATATPSTTAGRTPSVIVASPSGTPRATVAVSVAPSAAPSAPAASAPAASASAQASASAAGRAFVIANTDGEGLRMRSEPSTNSAEVTVLPEGARVTEIGPGRNAEGRDWLNVQDENGNKGWVAAEFTAPAP
jgi:hypothetical protein